MIQIKPLIKPSKDYYIKFNYDPDKSKIQKGRHSTEILQEISDYLYHQDPKRYPVLPTDPINYNFGRHEPIHIDKRDETFVIKAYIPEVFAEAIRKIYPRFILK